MQPDIPHSLSVQTHSLIHTHPHTHTRTHTHIHRSAEVNKVCRWKSWDSVFSSSGGSPPYAACLLCYHGLLKYNQTLPPQCSTCTLLHCSAILAHVHLKTVSSDVSEGSFPFPLSQGLGGGSVCDTFSRSVHLLGPCRTYMFLSTATLPCMLLIQALCVTSFSVL